MKKILLKSILLTTGFLFQIQANSQDMYVKADTYVYASNHCVYVKNDIELNASTSNFYLRKDGQLLQGTTGSGANKGLGTVSVFQEGTSDNYDYNYWCSPVGNVASVTSINNPFGITLLNQPTTITARTAATILAMNNYDGISNPLQIAPYWIYKFLSSSDYSGWVQVGAATTIQSGQGFTMKGTSGTDATNVGETVVNNPGGDGAQRYDFRGKPNDGDITVNVDTNKYTLTGNPYPSALNVNAFLLDAANSACTGVAYYWEQNKKTNSHYLAQYQGGYGVYSPVSLGSAGIYTAATFNTYNSDGSLNAAGASSGLSIGRKYAPIGQGFMVKGSSGGSITLRNSYREYYKESDPYSQFERSNQHIKNVLDNSNLTQNNDQPVSLLRINTTFNSQFTKQIVLAFVPEATDGVDRGIDALGASSISLPNDIYFFLNNDRYVIQGINFDVKKRIPLGVKATENANFKIALSGIENFDESQDIYLYDAEDGTYHDLKDQAFDVVLPTGIYNNRFEITFLNPTQKGNNIVKNNFVIFENNENQMLTVSNPNLMNVKSVALYDLTGKQIFGKVKLGVQKSYQFSTNGLPASVYLVEIFLNDNRKEVQKIIISNSKN